MDTKNNLGGPANGEAANIDGNDWRAHFTSDSRQRVLHRIVKILEDHIPEHAPENLPQLTAIATKFEEKVYYSAPTQEEYLRRISTKMVNIVSKPQSSGEVNSMQSNSSSTNQNPPDAVSQSVHSQMHNQAKSLPVPLTNPSQAQQSLSSHTVPNNITSAGVQSSGNLVSTLQSVTGLTDNTAPNAVVQSCNLQNVSGIPTNSVGQCLPPNILVHAQRQMQGRQHVQQVVAQQHQQPSQNPHHYIYPQQVQNQMLKKRRGNIQPPLLQSHIQQQQQNLLQPVQLQTSPSLQSNQNSFLQSQPTLQSTPLPSPLHPHSSSLQVSPSFLRQHHQSILLSQQKQQIIGKQPEETKTQQNQLLGQPNSSMEMQHQQQQKWLHQQQQQQQQQQVCQQNDISNFHQQLLGPQQQLIGTHPSVSNIQTNNQSVHIRQTQQTPSKLLPTQGQQSQSPQKQLMNQFQSQSPHLQQQMGLEKQQFSLQGEMHQRQTSGVLIQPQNVIEQQKQLLQLTRTRADPSSTATDSTTQRDHTNIVDGKEEIHQRYKFLREFYLPRLKVYYKKITNAIIQLRANAPPEHIHYLNTTKSQLERFLTVLEPPTLRYKKERLDEIENHMNIQAKKLKGAVISQQQGPQQFQPPGDHLLKSQVSQLKHHDNQMNSLMQPRNSQTSVATIQPTASLPSLSTHMGVSMVHPNVMTTTPNRHLQSNSNMLSNLNLKQQQTLQTQHVQQRPSSQQIVQQQDQQLLKQQHQQHQQLPLLQHQQQHNLHWQQKLQQSTQSLVHQMPQTHQMSEMNDLKVRQGMGVISGSFQNSAFHHQQIKTGALFSTPSPQPLQAASPQISQHSSPQIDQQSLLTSVSKTGTPLQSSNSPSIVPSPSTPISSSPLTGNPEKQTSGVSSLSNAGNIYQTPPPISLPQSHLVIGTPGISASPLLADFTCTDTNQGNASTIMFEKSSATEQPIDRLIKVVKSLSPKTLSASVDEIELAISMVDRMAASAAGNGSRASVGVDLVHSHAKWRKWLRQGNAIPLNVLSSDDSMSYSFKRVNDLETSELESTATSRIKRCRIEINHALMEEIREINQQLMNTAVDISDEDIKMTAAVGVQGTIVKCTFSTTTPSLGLKLQDVSAQTLPVLSMWLLVSSNYPNRSPTFLDKLPVNLSKEYEDLLMKTRSWYSRGLRCQQEPISLCKMVKDWDVCARAVVTEYAIQNGGGTFNTSYGGWEIC